MEYPIWSVYFLSNC